MLYIFCSFFICFNHKMGFLVFLTIGILKKNECSLAFGSFELRSSAGQRWEWEGVTLHSKQLSIPIPRKAVKNRPFKVNQEWQFLGL